VVATAPFGSRSRVQRCAGDVASEMRRRFAVFTVESRRSVRFGKNPTMLVCTPAVHNRQPRQVSDAIFTKLWDTLDGADAIVLGLAFFCGLRREEITRLRVLNVDVGHESWSTLSGQTSANGSRTRLRPAGGARDGTTSSSRLRASKSSSDAIPRLEANAASSRARPQIALLRCDSAMPISNRPIAALRRCPARTLRRACWTRALVGVRPLRPR